MQSILLKLIYTIRIIAFEFVRQIVKQETYLVNLTKTRNNILLCLLITNLKNLKFVRIRTIRSFILLY